MIDLYNLKISRLSKNELFLIDFIELSFIDKLPLFQLIVINTDNQNMKIHYYTHKDVLYFIDVDDIDIDDYFTDEDRVFAKKLVKIKYNV